MIVAGGVEIAKRERALMIPAIICLVLSQAIMSKLLQSDSCLKVAGIDEF